MSKISGWDQIRIRGWDQISLKPSTKPLRTGTQTVQIKNLRTYLHPRSGNRCVGFDLINQWGERFPYGLSLEAEQRPFLDQFVGRYLRWDPTEFDPVEIEKLEGQEFEIEVIRDEEGRIRIEPSAELGSAIG